MVPQGRNLVAQAVLPFGLARPPFSTTILLLEEQLLNLAVGQLYL
jgi:hypothetical protein